MTQRVPQRGFGRHRWSAQSFGTIRSRAAFAALLACSLLGGVVAADDDRRPGDGTVCECHIRSKEDWTLVCTGCPEPTASGADDAARRRQTECAMMRKWQAWNQAARTHYGDRTLLDEALEGRWSKRRYHEVVAERTRASIGAPPSDGAPSIMSTDSTTCELKNVESGCAWLREKGLPEVACAIARAHEEAHAKTCRERGGRSVGLEVVSRDEVSAYGPMLLEVEKWLGAHCRGG